MVLAVQSEDDKLEAAARTSASQYLIDVDSSLTHQFRKVQEGRSSSLRHRSALGAVIADAVGYQIEELSLLIRRRLADLGWFIELIF
jgi:hypothetical protein